MRSETLLRPAGRRRPGGFSLLEVMVALAVMAIVLTAVYRMHSQTLAMAMAARFQSEAPLLAQQKLAELAASGELPVSETGDFGEDFPDYRWSVNTEEVASEMLGEVGRDLRRIEVEVSSPAGSYRLRTYRFARVE